MIMYKVHAGELSETGHLLAIYREKAESGEVFPYAIIT